MSYYREDLSQYGNDFIYQVDRPSDDVRNVGWIDTTHPYNKWIPPEWFLDALYIACRHKVNLKRSYDHCRLCGALASPYPLSADRFSRKVALGDGEIRVRGQGIVHASPDLIYHYVEVHGYRPPDEFISCLQKRKYLSRAWLYKVLARLHRR